MTTADPLPEAAKLRAQVLELLRRLVEVDSAQGEALANLTEAVELLSKTVDHLLDCTKQLAAHVGLHRADDPDPN